MMTATAFLDADGGRARGPVPRRRPRNAPPPKPNDNRVNLAQNVDRLELAVDRMLPLHGPVVPLAELHRMIPRTNRAQRDDGDVSAETSPSSWVSRRPPR